MKLFWHTSLAFWHDVDKLIQGQSIEVDIQHDFEYETLNTDPEDSLWSLFYYAGYVTCAIAGPTYTVRIPNKEVLSEWTGWIFRLNPKFVSNNIYLPRL
jgi:hypothetical protein